MARFLSEAWFDALREDPVAIPSGDTVDLVLEQVVTGSPEGEVRYRIWLEDGVAHLDRSDTDMLCGPRVRLTGDYATVAAIAAGRLSTQAALLQGRFTVTGSTAALSAHQAALRVDLMPAALRESTTY